MLYACLALASVACSCVAMCLLYHDHNYAQSSDMCKAVHVLSHF